MAANSARPISPRVSSLSGQWIEIASALASISSKAIRPGPGAAPLRAAKTGSMPKAAAFSATADPMTPAPTMQRRRPARSRIG